MPVHFSGGGAPDSWSSRAAALWTFGLLGVGTGLLFMGLVWFGAWTLLLLAVVRVLVVRAAGMEEPRLGPEGFGAIGMYLLVVVARTAWALTRRYAVPTDGREAVSPGRRRPPPGPPR